jgi:hypothetical protein
MTFEELKSQIKSCKFDETRVDNNAFFEAVVGKANLEALNAKLSSIFGPPALPSGNKLSAEANDIVQHHGGVMAGQTLYFTHIDSAPVFAMLWPWGDKEHITVKIGMTSQ